MTVQRLLLVLVPALLVSCGSMGPPPTDEFYRLLLPAPAAQTMPVSQRNNVAFVAPFQASGLHGERALIYAYEDGTSLSQYHYHFWIDSPRIMLQQALVKHLESALGLTVLDTATRDANYLITGRIHRFERDSSNGDQTVVALHLEVRTGAAAVPVFSRRYERRQAIAADSVPAAVTAFNQLVAAIFSDFADDWAQSM